ncbi:hypothetical protein [Streptomyces sp. NPDC102409]|uniref:ISAzo13-like element transposase-related protein n=1 Tax=Streptomyces sp. NPDC102409 TaxID=3366172 RepID=UPI00380C9F5A
MPQPPFALTCGPQVVPAPARAACGPPPGLRDALLSLVEPDERGDPRWPSRWTSKSTRTPAAELTRQRHLIGAAPSPVRCGRGADSRPTPRRSRTASTPTGDAEFRYLDEQTHDHRPESCTARRPVLGAMPGSGAPSRGPPPLLAPAQ